MTSVATLPSAPKSGRRSFEGISQPLLLVYWAVCLSVIAMGLDNRFPEIRRDLTNAIFGPQLSKPFANCAAAHAAGVYNIRSSSPGYLPSQDADNDGVACEPEAFIAPDLRLKSPI